MNLIAKILLKTFILCNLLLLATSSNIDFSQAEIDDLAHPDNFVHTGNLSELVDIVEPNNDNISLHHSQNLTFTSAHSNPPSSSEGQYVDPQNQSVENIFTIPEHLPRKHKLSSETITDNIEYQPPDKCRKVSDNNQSSSPKENAFVYADEFSHKHSNLFSKSEKFFKLEEYRAVFKYYCRSFFIEEFCDEDQLQSLQFIGISWSENWNEGNFAKLEVYLRRMIFENVVAKRKVNQTAMYEYQTINIMLDPERTKELFYLLVYSFYETGMIGLPRSKAAVKKILINIVTHTRLTAYINNDSVKRALQLKKSKRSKRIYSAMPKSKQNNFSQSNFRYTDFTKVLTGACFPKKPCF